jgi:putative membrane protein
MRLSEADHDRVTTAVAAAEAGTDGEIVTIVARQSDPYHDVALHWAVLAMLLVLALLASIPGAAEWLHALVADPWGEAPTSRMLFTLALVAMTVAFLIVRVALNWGPLRMALTPKATRARRVRRRALMLFRTAAEARTRNATGVLLYLSLAEHRAEIVADATIHTRVSPDVWGEAMAALIVAVKDGRPGDGMAAAVERIGVVLAEHFPRSSDDTNELPDRLIEL